jgi:hypothetical protein
LEAAPETPVGLAEIVMALLQKDPNARYQRGHDVAEAIYHWMHESGIREEAPVRASRPL